MVGRLSRKVSAKTWGVVMTRGRRTVSSDILVRSFFNEKKKNHFLSCNIEMELSFKEVYLRVYFFNMTSAVYRSMHVKGTWDSMSYFLSPSSGLY